MIHDHSSEQRIIQQEKFLIAGRIELQVYGVSEPTNAGSIYETLL